MNWLQTNGVIYLPVVVKGAALVFAFLAGRETGGYLHSHQMTNPALQLLGQRRRQCPNFDPALR